MLLKKLTLIQIPFFRRQFSSNLLTTLKERGLISQVSQPEDELLKTLKEAPQTLKLYSGADPTAKSLHLGNLVPLMVMLHFYLNGHDVVALIGGATGKVGDPSGRKTERQQMLENIRNDNVTKIQRQQIKFFENGLKYYRNLQKGGVIVSNKQEEQQPGKIISENNYNWWKDIKLLDFLSTYGRFIKVQSMLSRESVTSRLENNKDGLGFNEFAYQILQAFDFYHLNKTYGVNIQLGGNDQWGNIIAGIDFIGRTSKAQVYGLTVPLLTTATGEKFGKSSGNAIFISSKINTPYDMYQYFYNVADADVSRFLKIFTLLPISEIERINDAHYKNPTERLGQRVLAKHVVDLIHGCGDNAEKISLILFNDNELGKLSGKHFIELFGSCGVLSKVSKEKCLLSVIMELSNCSKSEARRKLKQGSVYLGLERAKITNETEELTKFLIDDRVLILRLGKQKCHIVEMV
ncbi:related to Tyrosine--tRNA ligase, mitochondrial [Saccharomycodes ludwigii]|uniref:Tyrosine--tRNA ligase n=1 Tax=Saccharomycodes ludwigii TaxID=36035 RepID=A0A376B9Y1_9ASCO|nr:hypothetical protein SCDLUD_002048 [Saccharomycodes ludwigii]KAH3902231.1 hypothetical protein SCDLUD_002048 [Saccharomycodes ludwigii]SSD61483.1 related to Tyrosine--tRNA ligase, mitochondrial [Saccharomycodes ludwigii]